MSHVDDDRQRIITLDELGGRPSVEEWREVTWSSCADCSDTLVGPADADERLYDGEPLVCTAESCGLVHAMSADAEGWHVGAREDLSGRWVYLTAEALAAVREVVGG